MPVLCAFVLHVSAAAALHGSRRQRNGFFVSDWKGTVPDEFEGCAENASVVRLRSSRLSSGRVLRPSEAKKRLLRALSIVPVSDWKGTVPDEFESCAENASVVRLRSSRLSSGRALRLPEAKELLLYALSIVPVSDWKGTFPDEFEGCAENASVVRLRSSRLSSVRTLRLPDGKELLLRALSIVPVSDWKGTVPDEFEGCAENASVVRLRSSRLSSGRVLRPSEAKKRLLRALSIVPVSDWKGTVPDEFEGCAENASVVRLRSSRLSSGRVLRPSEAKKRLLRALSIVPVSDWKGTVPDEFESCAENARVVRLRSSRLSSGRALRLPEAKELLLYALSIVPLAVLSKARLLPKAARDRRLAPDSSRLASSVCLSACIFAESFSPLSHKEKLCLH
ncbi:unnamed protein product [Coccothraustes coccothraustes]